MKTNANDCRHLQTTYPCYSIAKSTLYILITFLKIEQTKCGNLSFVHFLSSSFSIMHNSKTIMVYASIIYTKQVLSYWEYSFFDWSCVWATIGELQCWNCLHIRSTFSFGHSFGFSCNNCTCMHVDSRLLQVSFWESLLDSCTCVWVKVWLSFWLLTWFLRTIYCNREWPLKYSQHSTVCFQGCVDVTSSHVDKWAGVLVSRNHLDTSSVWKSLVASCVCVGRGGWISNTLSSCFQRVCFQRKMCLSPAQNVFITSHKSVRLQCSIVFGDE